MEDNELIERLEYIESALEQIQLTLERLSRHIETELMELKDRVSTLEYYRRA